MLYEESMDTMTSNRYLKARGGGGRGGGGRSRSRGGGSGGGSSRSSKVWGIISGAVIGLCILFVCICCCCCGWGKEWCKEIYEKCPFYKKKIDKKNGPYRGDPRLFRFNYVDHN